MKLKGRWGGTVKAGAFSKPEYKTIFLGFSPKRAFLREGGGGKWRGLRQLLCGSAAALCKGRAG